MIFEEVFLNFGDSPILVKRILLDAGLVVKSSIFLIDHINSVMVIDDERVRMLELLPCLYTFWSLLLYIRWLSSARNFFCLELDGRV